MTRSLTILILVVALCGCAVKPKPEAKSEVHFAQASQPPLPSLPISTVADGRAVQSFSAVAPIVDHKTNLLATWKFRPGEVRMTILSCTDLLTGFFYQWGYTTNEAIKCPMTNAYEFFWFWPVKTNQLPKRFDYSTLE